MKTTVILLLAFALAACRGDDETPEPTSGDETSRGIEPWDDYGRCDVLRERTSVAEYDTTGDGRPDVRKVFLTGGAAGGDLGGVLVCREADLDGDGIKDLFRFYHDDGQPFREEADRDFDGDIDELSYFDGSRLIRRDVDTNDDGAIDTRTYFERDLPVRRELDTSGRSTPESWRPNRWEYYAEGRLIRMGEDLDGDGSADRWDRDPSYHAEDDDAPAAPEEPDPTATPAGGAPAQAATPSAAE